MNGIQRSPTHYWESQAAIIKPYLFDATVAPNNIRIELTPSSHGSILRVTFPKEQITQKHVCFSNGQWNNQQAEPYQSFDGHSSQVTTDRSVITNFHLYSYIISPEAKKIETLMDLHCFKYPNEATVVHVHMATSLISQNQAKLNYQNEVLIGKISFDILAETAKSIWNK